MQVSQKPQKEMQVDSNNLYTVTQQWQIAATEQTEREFKKNKLLLGGVGNVCLVSLYFLKPQIL